MAGGKVFQPIEIDPAAERRWQLARREDLGNAFGIMLSVAEHGQDEGGNWRYGLRPTYGIADPRFHEEFEREMRVLIAERVSALVASGVLTPDQAAAVEEHSYSVGPAAQEWPKVFFDFYQDARPFFSDGASWLAWAYFFKDVIRGIRSWASDKEREQHEAPGEPSATTYAGTSVMPGIVLTQPAVVSLCYADLVDRHAVTEQVTIETFPHSFTSYATPDHPAGQESYLIRVRAGRRSFFYHVMGTGEVREHYLMVGSTLTLLDLPSLVGEKDARSSRAPQPSQGIKIRAR